MVYETEQVVLIFTICTTFELHHSSKLSLIWTGPATFMYFITVLQLNLASLRISVGQVTTVSVWVMLLKLSNAARAGPVQTLHMNLQLTTQYPSPKFTYRLNIEIPLGLLRKITFIHAMLCKCKRQDDYSPDTTYPPVGYGVTNLLTDNETVDKAAHMAKPNNYINGTRKNLVSSDNEGRMVEKCIVEIQGTFLEKIRVAHEWFTKEFMGLITTWDSMVEKFILKFHHLSDHNDDEEEEDSSETDNAPEFFMIEGNLFDFETPLCKAYNKINYLLKFDTDLFTYDIQSLKGYYE
ncbi:hypothetical protein Tco_0848073 [Tanacetum coccineum]